jgi:prepilin-type N-terminal cleavage/methylation domain-containing protein
MTRTDFSLKQAKGFTLIEMAMVLLIVALLLGGLVPTLSSQVDQRHASETSKQLDEIKEALVGYAIINGRLPCPASSSSSGQEDPVTGTGICTYFTNATATYDYLPAVTLGLSGTDSSGLLEDAWGNPIRYAVTPWQSSGTYVYSTSGGMSTAGISNLSSSNLNVCSTATGISGSNCASGSTLTSNAVAVIYSTGKNGGSGGTGTDEAENLNPNGTDGHSKVFVSHTPTPSSATNGEFDDIVTWISPNVLVNRMVTAGKLP